MTKRNDDALDAAWSSLMDAPKIDVYTPQKVGGAIWHTPPENQGQSITVSYALADTGHIIERTEGDIGATYEVYIDADPDEEFAPWNTAPELGCRIEGEYRIGGQ